MIHPYGRRRIAAFLACVAILASAPIAAASITPRGNKLWSALESATYEFGTWSSRGNSYTVPTWLRAVVTDVMENGYDDNGTNNSKGPVFSFSTSNDITVYWSPTNPISGSSGWLGTVDATTFPARIWIRSNPSSGWCDLNLHTGCADAGRVTIHEVGHVGGFLNHNTTSSFSVTVMDSPDFPYYGDHATYNSRHLGSCDEAAMQLWYDLVDFAGPYADCFSTIANHGSEGLVTDLSASPSSVTACANEVVTISGHLNVHDYSSYETLGGNALRARTVWIDRDATPKYSSAVTTTSSTANWSKTFSGSNVTFHYVAHYDSPSSEGLDDSPDRAFTITWLSPQVVC